MINKVISVGKYTPNKILTNHDLEKMVDTSDEWISDRTGIKERRIASNTETASYMGAEAIKRACDKINMPYEEIDFVICATNSPDTLFPSTAMRILQHLNIIDRPGIDIQAGCTSFCYGIELADSLLKNGGRYKKIALVGVEKLSSLIDWEDRNTCVLFGDGAGAVIISASENDGRGIISSVLGGDSSKTEAIRLEAGMSSKPTTMETLKSREHFVRMEGQDVFKFAVRVIVSSIKNLLKNVNMKIEQISRIIPHQANARIVEAAAKLLQVPYEKFFMNIHKYGNTSAATVPIALEEAFEEKKIKTGDTIITVGFGAGLTYAANMIKL